MVISILPLIIIKFNRSLLIVPSIIVILLIFTFLVKKKNLDLIAEIMQLFIFPVGTLYLGFMLSMFLNNLKASKNYPKLELVYEYDADLNEKNVISPYLYVLDNDVEPETVKCALRLFNFGTDLTRNVLVALDIPLSHFEYLRSTFMNPSEIKTVSMYGKNKKIAYNEKMQRISRYINNDVVMPILSSYPIDSLYLLTKRGGVSSAWDYSFLRISLRYQNMINTDIKCGYLLVISPRISADKRDYFMNKAMKYNHDVAEGKIKGGEFLNPFE